MSKENYRTSALQTALMFQVNSQSRERKKKTINVLTSTMLVTLKKNLHLYICAYYMSSIVSLSPKNLYHYQILSTIFSVLEFPSHKSPISPSSKF